MIYDIFLMGGLVVLLLLFVHYPSCCIGLCYERYFVGFFSCLQIIRKINEAMSRVQSVAKELLCRYVPMWYLLIAGSATVGGFS